MINSSRFLELLERYKVSGLSVRGFCSNEGIAPSTSYYWKKKIFRDTPGKRFIPLVVQTPGSAAYPTPSWPDSHRMADSPLEISYPNGTTLRIKQTLDLAGLRSLVFLLD